MADIEQALLRGDGLGLPAPLALHARRGSLLFSGWRRSSRYAVRMPVRSPRPLVSGEKALGLAMLRGQFTFAGSTITSAPANLFDIAAPSLAWREDLVVLAWLQHFAATPLHLARISARATITAWQQQTLRRLKTHQAARALIALSAHAEFLLQEAGSEFYKAFSTIVGKLSCRMQPAFIETAENALCKAIALSHAAITFQFAKPVREAALAQIIKSIDQVVLPDGGHISRSPARLVELALDLIPLQHALRASHLAVPAPLNAAIERILPMLRLLLHSDGALAALHDGGSANQGGLQAVLAADTSCGRPLALAPYSGFGRLAYQDGTVLMDLGQGGPCNSPLAFEFSDAGQRLIVSCGRPAASQHPWHSMLASAAAHSSWDIETDLASLAPAVKAESVSSPQGGLLRGKLLARSWRRQATHERILFLAATGTDLRGEDHIRIERAGAEPCCLRFHLHPLLTAEPAPHPNCVSLALADGRTWIFSQAGGCITIEDSIYCEAGGSMQPSRQIVVRSSQSAGLDVLWALRRTSVEQLSRKAPA